MYISSNALGMSHFTMFQLDNMITTQTTFQRSDLAAASRHHGQNVLTWENPLLEPFYKKSNLLRTEKTLSHTRTQNWSWWQNLCLFMWLLHKCLNIKRFIVPACLVETLQTVDYLKHSDKSVNFKGFWIVLSTISNDIYLALECTNETLNFNCAWH